MKTSHFSGAGWSKDVIFGLIFVENHNDGILQRVYINKWIEIAEMCFTSKYIHFRIVLTRFGASDVFFYRQTVHCFI